MPYLFALWRSIAISETDQAAQECIWDRTIDKIKAKNAKRSQEGIESIIEEGLA